MGDVPRIVRGREAGRQSREHTEKGRVRFRFVEDLAKPQTLGRITERTISRYAMQLRENELKAATIQGHLAYLRAAFRWAADQRFIPVAPKIVMPKVPKKKAIRKIVLEEYERLAMKAPRPYWHALIATAWYTGMRRTKCST